MGFLALGDYEPDAAFKVWFLSLMNWAVLSRTEWVFLL
jgi:hypothetical protein